LDVDDFGLTQNVHDLDVSFSMIHIFLVVISYVS
jgi:hypothetical protein